MNARSQLLELELEPRQVEEGILCLFHSVLFHRTTGKFSYKDSCSYHINALGYEDVDCDYIDHTYLRTHSATLTQLLATEVGNFGTELRAAGRGIGSGQGRERMFDLGILAQCTPLNFTRFLRFFVYPRKMIMELLCMYCM